MHKIGIGKLQITALFFLSIIIILVFQAVHKLKEDYIQLPIVLKSWFNYMTVLKFNKWHFQRYIISFLLWKWNDLTVNFLTHFQMKSICGRSSAELGEQRHRYMTWLTEILFVTNTLKLTYLSHQMNYFKVFCIHHNTSNQSFWQINPDQHSQQSLPISCYSSGESGGAWVNSTFWLANATIT